MKKLYKFYWDCGRQGSITSVFSATQEEINNALGKKVYFGECLGKHSEIYGTLESGDLKVLTEDSDFIEKFDKLIGSTGKNPLNYLEENL